MSNDLSKKKEIVPPVSIKRFVQALPILYRVKEVPVLLISDTGLGKTQSVKQFCDSNKLDYKNIRLSYLEAQDIVGFPQVHDNRMFFIQPEFLPTDHKSKGVLFFDEINRARIDVLQAVFQLILERELGVGSKLDEIYKVPDDWFIIAAQNPDTDEYYVSPMDSALFNRFCIIPVTYSETAYKDYIKTIGSSYNQSLYNFIQEQQLLIHQPHLKKIEIKPTPRSFELFNKILSKMLPGEFHLLDIFGNGLIGPGNFKNFLQFLLQSDKEIETLLQQILAGTFEKDKKKVDEIVRHKTNIVIGAFDRFITKYVKNFAEFHDIQGSKKGQHLLNFVFHLPNEQIVACLLGIKKEMDHLDKGADYMMWIQEYLLQNDSANDRYEEIISVHSELQVDYFI